MKDVDKLISLLTEFGIGHTLSEDSNTVYMTKGNDRVYGYDGHEIDFSFTSNGKFLTANIHSDPSESWLLAKLDILYGTTYET